MPGIAQFFNHLIFRWRWKRTRRKGRTLRLRLGHVRDFLAALNEADISYVVLRWFDEVPLTPEAELEGTAGTAIVSEAVDKVPYKLPKRS